MISTTIIIKIITIVLGFLAVGILLWVNTESNHSKRVLILFLIVISISNLNGVLFHSGWYLRHPQFHKILYPFALLIAPLSYLYIRSVVWSEFRFRKYDWLILVPSILLFVTLTPYYLMPITAKIKYLTYYYSSNEARVQSSNGILPGYFFSFIRSTWSLLFIVFNYRVIENFTKQATPKALIDNHIIIRWIKTLNYTLSVLLLTSIVSAILAPIFKDDFHFVDISLALLTLIICLALFSRPKILYGIYLPIRVQDNNSTNEVSRYSAAAVSSDEEKPTKIEAEKEFKLNTSDVHHYKNLLDSFFENQQPFLKPDYTLDQLVTELNVPRYALSAFINREYNMGFREFLNRQRINYLLMNLEKSEWQFFTLEAIAKECGFKSRTTFINNFKDITGLTPSAYIKRVQDEFPLE
jgi:AraC-like DNA-binding protein